MPSHHLLSDTSRSAARPAPAIPPCSLPPSGGSQLPTRPWHLFASGLSPSPRCPSPLSWKPCSPSSSNSPSPLRWHPQSCSYPQPRSPSRCLLALAWCPPAQSLPWCGPAPHSRAPLAPQGMPPLEGMGWAPPQPTGHPPRTPWARGHPMACVGLGGPRFGVAPWAVWDPKFGVAP